MYPNESIHGQMLYFIMAIRSRDIFWKACILENAHVHIEEESLL